MSEDVDEAGSTRVRELMRRAADGYQPAVDLVPGVLGDVRRVRRNRRIGISVGGFVAVLCALVVTVLGAVGPAANGSGGAKKDPALGTTGTGTGSPSILGSPAPLSAGHATDSNGFAVFSGVPSSSVSPDPQQTLPGTWISPPGATYGLPWEVSIDSGAVSNPCIYLLLPINAGSRAECVMHYLPDLSAADTSSTGDGVLADSTYLLIGNYSPFPTNDNCGLALIVFATQNVARVDITGIWDNDYLTLYPKDTGEPDAYTAAVVNLGAQYTFTSMDGSTSSPRTVSGQETCPPASS